MSECPGKTPKGKPCGRAVVPGASMCTHHYKLQQRELAEQQRIADFAEHCKTKCDFEKGCRSGWCQNPRAKPHHLCKRHKKAVEKAARERAEIAERQAKAREAQHERDQQMRKHMEAFAKVQGESWWPAFEQWIDEKIQRAADNAVDCAMSSSTPYW